MNYSTSKQLIENSKSFLNIKKYTLIDRLLSHRGIFYGWGRKASGYKAIALANKYNTSYFLLEDGFIRSLDLAVNGAPSVSMIKDDIGIYYDATKPSKLENILNFYNFKQDHKLMQKAKDAISLIKKYHISKYNNSNDVSKSFRDKYGLYQRGNPVIESTNDGLNKINSDISKASKDIHQDERKNILVIAQTAGDSSLEYGLAEIFSTRGMLDAAIKENPYAKIYLKIHPDVLNGNKASDIDLVQIDKSITIIAEDINPISLLKLFDRVYTKTSGMGFEALLVDCKCVCFGMPFYAGWGVTDDRVSCDRRQRKLSVEEIFAASYILYTQYYDPILQQETDIIAIINYLNEQRNFLLGTKNSSCVTLGLSKRKKKLVTAFFSGSSNYKNIHNPWLFKIKKQMISRNIITWGRPSSRLEKKMRKKNMNAIIVEDGFIRSVGLGAHCVPPMSLVFDKCGIYYDSTRTSDHEKLCLTKELSDAERIRAQTLIQTIIDYQITKYNSEPLQTIRFNTNKKIILVIGQVVDDQSVKFGSPDVRDNLELLKRVKNSNQNAYIVYKPHPDVLSAKRIGHVENASIYADEIITNISIINAIDACHELHTMTSLAGFDAIIRQKTVVCYGMPFYAGWGLTIDKIVSSRRKRKLDLETLVHITLIDYPIYYDLESKSTMQVEKAIEKINKMRDLRSV